ncbi:MAG: alginate export family protein [Planctomycetes bacterium]|nr:alginate export family protein [Planctomycetota bacterium]
MPTVILTLFVATQAAPEPKPQEPKEAPVLRVPLVRKASLGGQIRLRAEMKDPFDYRLPGTFGRPAAEDVKDGDEFVLLRARLHVDLELQENLRAFVQIQDSRSFGEEASVLGDLESTDLHQGWVEAGRLFDEPLALRAGRMEVPDLGDKRLIGSLDWHNIARSWDGVSVTYAPPTFWGHGFATLVNEDPGTNGRDQYFYGLYASCRAVEKHEFDAYLFARDFRNDPVTGEDGVAGDLTDFTFGARVKGAIGGFDYGGEAAVQRGDYATDRSSADAFALVLGYTFDCPCKPRIGVELTRASGDDDPTDEKRGTFDPLLSFGHAYHGYYDLVMWKNVRTLMIALKAQPADCLALGLDTHFFRLDEDRDGWYSVPLGATIRRDSTGSADDEIGWEIDAHAKINLSDRAEAWIGVSHFHAGEFVEDTGTSPDGMWVFAQTTFRF